LCYFRATRADTEPIYDHQEDFVIGGSKTLKSSDSDQVTVIAAGITVYEALEAHQKLAADGISIRVIDLYSIKPLDQKTLAQAANQTKAIITVEDHYAEGGLGEAVMSALADTSTPIYQLAVRKIPRSGQPEELMAYEEIDCEAIIKQVKKII
jgi:transketolase